MAGAGQGQNLPGTCSEAAPGAPGQASKESGRCRLLAAETHRSWALGFKW